MRTIFAVGLTGMLALGMDGIAMAQGQARVGVTQLSLHLLACFSTRSQASLARR
jgi:hypothetical protein